MSTVDVFTLPVHPAAEVFPMLPPDELAELAEDIRANGLQHPIVVKAGKLIDGRNRLAACAMAGVEPRTVELNGQDPTAYVLSTNIARRHLTKGQRAMATAMLYPTAEDGGRGRKSSLNEGFGSAYLSQARKVLDKLPEVAFDVLAGKVSLNDAYDLARAAEDETADDAAQRKARKGAEAEARSRRLDAVAEVDAGLAEAVKDGRTKLDDAEAIANEKRARLEACRSTAALLLRDLKLAGTAYRKPSFRQTILDHAVEHIQAEAQRGAVIDALNDAAALIQELIERAGP